MAKKKTSKKSVKTKKRVVKKISWVPSKKQQVLAGLFLFFLGLGLLLAFTSYLFHWKADQDTITALADRSVQANNVMNKFGAGISHFFMFKGFGIAAYQIAFLLSVTGFYWFFRKPAAKLKSYWFWGLLLMLWLCTVLGFFAPEQAILSGIVGYELNDYLQDYLGFAGTILVLSFLFLAYLIIRYNLTPDVLGQYFKTTRAQVKADFDEAKDVEQAEIDAFLEQEKAKAEAEAQAAEDNNLDKNGEEKEKTLGSSITFENTQPEKVSAKADDKAEPAKIIIGNQTDDVAMEVEQAAEEEVDEGNLSNKLVKDFGEFDPTLELKNFKFPTLELLVDHSSGKGGITINQEELENNKNNIVNTLKNYKIEIAQIKATVGPTVTLYEIVPEAGVRISKIKNLEDDIALSLSALGIRIIAPIPGKGTIGIEVPNKNPSIVSMRSVIGSTKFQNAEMQLPIALGKNISNETFVADLAKMPHLLMAGATGQGKSVGLNAILTSLLYQKHPAEVKFVLVDPKKVELTLFNKIERHYLAKLPNAEEAIITDNTKVIHTLNSLCIEMDSRYELLKDAMVRNIKEYNEKFKARKLNPENGHKFLPYIVLVVDEFADLIMTAGKEVEIPIARLAQLARAIGIHLIIATQRPSVNVITGMIKANFPARIAFRVTSKIDSRTILDTGGADQLIGKGDMLYTQGNNLIRLQCAFVDTPEVEKITDFIGAQKAYPDAHILPEYEGEENGTGLDIDVSERDSLFNQAAEVLVTAQQGSASLLQRKLKIGYNRAGRIIDQMEAAGIVGPFEGSKARQVLITDLNALEEFLNEA